MALALAVFDSDLHTTPDSLSARFEQEELVLLGEIGPLMLKTRRRNPGTHPGNTPPHPRACLGTVGVNLPLCDLW